ncbi:MAG: hypothetical protein K0R15_2937 [Clostridiales bacterium]|jgi:hypothetical protein|nr:hypothetical protein [Clostridiales bacterium]
MEQVKNVSILTIDNNIVGTGSFIDKLLKEITYESNDVWFTNMP